MKKSVDRIKDGEIVTLPNNITDEVLSDSQWSDFRKEFPKYNYNFVNFRNIRKYLDKKNEYNELRKDCLNEIITKVKNLNITKIEKFLIKSMKKSKFKGTKENLFRKIIAEDLSISILQKEKTKNEFSNELFEKYKKSLFKIREKPAINEKINNIIKFSKKLEKFQRYSKILKNSNRYSLITKYNLTDYDWKTFKKSKN